MNTPNPSALILIRHGEAEHRASSDSLRELTDRGREQARLTGKRLRNWRSSPAVSSSTPKIYSSPLIRARQTAEIIASQADLDAAGMLDFIQPGSDPVQAQILLEALRVESGTGPILIVSHMPFLPRLQAWITQGSNGESEPFNLAEPRLFVGLNYEVGQLSAEPLPS